MSAHVKELRDAAIRLSKMSAEDKEVQRRSFAFGNAKIDNTSVTKEMIDEAAVRLKPQHDR